MLMSSIPYGGALSTYRDRSLVESGPRKAVRNAPGATTVTPMPSGTTSFANRAFTAGPASWTRAPLFAVGRLGRELTGVSEQR